MIITISYSPTKTKFWGVGTVRRIKQREVWIRGEKQVIFRNRRERRKLEQQDAKANSIMNTRNDFQKAEIWGIPSDH